MLAAVSTSRAYPALPARPSYVDPRRKFDLCQSKEDFHWHMDTTLRKIDSVTKKILITTILGEVVILALNLVFMGVTAYVSYWTKTSCADYNWLYVFNLLYLINLWDPAKKGCAGLKYASDWDWDIIVFNMRDRLKYEKIRFALAIYLGAAFCFFIFVEMFIVNIRPMMIG